MWGLNMIPIHRLHVSVTLWVQTLHCTQALLCVHSVVSDVLYIIMYVLLSAVTERRCAINHANLDGAPLLYTVVLARMGPSDRPRQTCAL